MLEFKFHAINRLDYAPSGEEISLQVVDLEYHITHLRAYTLLLGSKASLSPSPKKLKARTVRKSMIPGSTATHQAVSRVCWPDSRIIPQLGTVGSPKPIKLKAASARITPGMDNVAMMIIRLMTLGIRWRETALLSLA